MSQLLSAFKFPSVLLIFFSFFCFKCEVIKYFIQVFLWRTWASVRVMTADQRAELLKRVVNDDLNKKLPFKECEKIAEDLNLTLEQVSLYLSFLD